jgi:hypothetical protein
MTPNEVISKWRGECRHNFPFAVSPEGNSQCSGCKEEYPPNNVQWPPDYTTDPAAWTPELFDRIEEAGLKKKFVYHLGIQLDAGLHTSIAQFGWLYARSTPAQKAEALSRAIIEEWNKDAEYQTRLVQEDR